MLVNYNYDTKRMTAAANAYFYFWCHLSMYYFCMLTYNMTGGVRTVRRPTCIAYTHLL